MNSSKRVQQKIIPVYIYDTLEDVIANKASWRGHACVVDGVLNLEPLKDLENLCLNPRAGPNCGVSLSIGLASEGSSCTAGN